MILIQDSLSSNWTEHLTLLFSGVTVTALIGHAVNTFPTQNNPYVAWFIGLVQWFVGQRQQAYQTQAVARDTKEYKKFSDGDGPAKP